MVRAICGVQYIEKKRFKDLMDMFELNELNE